MKAGDNSDWRSNFGRRASWFLLAAARKSAQIRSEADSCTLNEPWHSPAEGPILRMRMREHMGLGHTKVK